VFSVWDEDGNYREVEESRHPARYKGSEMAKWPVIATNKLTRAVAEVAVLVNDNTVEHDTVILAGTPGFKMSSVLAQD
jgi:hypothetical protein